MFPFGKKPESADPVDDAITTKTRVFEKPSTLWPKGKTLERTPEMIEEELQRARDIELAEQKDAERAKLAAAIENMGQAPIDAPATPEEIAWLQISNEAMISRVTYDPPATTSSDIFSFTLAPYDWWMTRHRCDYDRGKECVMRWRLTEEAIRDYNCQPVTFALPAGKTEPDYDFMFELAAKGIVHGEEIEVIDFDPAKYDWQKVEIPIPLGGLAGLIYSDSVPHAAKEEEWPKRIDTDLLSFDEIMQLRGQALNAAVATLAHLNPPYRQRNCAADIVLDIQETVKAFEHYLLTGKWHDA